MIALRQLGLARLAAVLLLASALPARALGSPGPPGAFRALQASRRGAATAVALDPTTGRIAVGDTGGVLLGRAGAPLARVLRRGPVLDLVFYAASRSRPSELLAATEVGLYRLPERGGAVSVAPGPGEQARRVARLAADGGVLAAATGAGLFASRDARRWRRLVGSLPGGAAQVVALRAGPPLECWAAFGERLWKLWLDPESLAVTRAERIRTPGAETGEGAVDILLHVAGADAILVYPNSLVWRAAPDAAWQVLRPRLPPGARARRLGAALGRYWLATDRGLLEAPSLASGWHRARTPVGSQPIQALAGDAVGLFAAAERGLFAGTPERPPSGRSPLRAESGEPSIQVVHRVALAYLGLEARRIDALRGRLGRRGWLPRLSFGVGYADDESRSTDFDESFVSGETRFLTDRDVARDRDTDVSVSLVWELGNTAYDPEVVDLSREARALTELRDDVLDEITQLYFERRRVLVELAQQDEPHGAEAELLRLRAAGLAAGIAAWTGGWFSARVSAP